MSFLSESHASNEEQSSSFLDFPAEIRNMIYDEYLPQTVTVGRTDDPELAILSTCRQVYKETLPILKKRTACHLIIRCPKSLQLARAWINQSGGSSTSTTKTLDVDSCTEFNRLNDCATFRQYRFSFAFNLGSPKFTDKYTIPGDGPVTNYEYSQDCLSGRQSLPDYLKKVMDRLLGRALHVSVSTALLEEILEAIASYSEWVHKGQTECLELQTVRQLPEWTDPVAPERQGWVYLYPDAFPNEPKECYVMQEAPRFRGITSPFNWGSLLTLHETVSLAGAIRTSRAAATVPA